MRTLKAIITASILMLLTVPFTVMGESMTVTGTVKDPNNDPLIGVTVFNKNNKKGAITNIDGNFTIEAKKGDVLVVSYLGYEQQEVVVTASRIEIIMQSAEMLVDEVVVIGYGTQKRSMMTGSTQRMGSNSKNRIRSATPARSAPQYDMYYPGGEEYGNYKDNKFIPVSKDPLSTFSLDVDAASYSNVRRMINQGQKPVEDAVRIEEMINYFSYDYAKPKHNSQHPVKINYQVGECPWNKSHKLVSIGVKAKEIPSQDLPATNFVFLIDVSGSMAGRIELVKSSFKLLVNNLRPEDKVAIVVYASDAGIKLPSTSGSDKQKINEAIDALRAAGSTAGGKGIQLAYKVARENFNKNGNNRIILATDGDFNVGVSSPEELERLIVKERESGVFLTVLGYGMGNYKDKRIQILAEKGNGNHAYIDNMQEANKVMVNEFGGSFHTVAKDVKLQVEFNPTHVSSYRLLGYESRMLEHEDFNNDSKDAGDLGVGHTVTALYEIVPTGVKSDHSGSIDDLKYQKKTKSTKIVATDYSDELMTVKLRYKDADSEKSKLMESIIRTKTEQPNGDFYFASAVAMFGQLLRDSEYKGESSYDLVIETARKGLDNDEHGYRREFIRLVQAAKNLK